MPERRVMVCAHDGRDALRLVRVGGRDLCPKHALIACETAIREGATEIEVTMPEQRESVVPMRRRR